MCLQRRENDEEEEKVVEEWAAVEKEAGGTRACSFDNRNKTGRVLGPITLILDYSVHITTDDTGENRRKQFNKK